jgi:predicted nucleotidyltransferase component of viral defense system
MPPSRYSEDVDLIQIIPEPIGETLDRLKDLLSFLGKPSTQSKKSNNTLVFRYEAEEPQGVQMRLKIEINCREHFSIFGHEILPFEVDNQWYSGKCEIVTYQIDELIASKVRALYQRRKGRDLYDLFRALQSGQLNVEASIDCYKKYMDYQGNRIPTTMEYKQNLDEKMEDENFRSEIFRFLSQDIEYDIDVAHETILKQIVSLM